MLNYVPIFMPALFWIIFSKVDFLIFFASKRKKFLISLYIVFKTYIQPYLPFKNCYFFFYIVFHQEVREELLNIQ